MGIISYFNEGVSFRLEGRRLLKKWISEELGRGGRMPGEISFIFCSDEFLRGMNKSFLNHDYYTDIITFDLSEDEINVNCDVYISLDRVRENARRYGQGIQQEVRRVMIHGILHILGQEDKSDDQKEAMRKLEDQALNRLKNTKLQ
jgi:probable rRNA maturation factor